MALLALQQAQLTASEGAAYDDFGRSVAISGDTALVGVPYDTVGGNAYQGSAYVFSPDSTAPTTTASGLQASASSGWIKSSQLVSLAPTDAGGSGVAATCYTIAGVQHTYAVPFAVSAAGSHTVIYWSTDAAGNEEPHHSGYVNIDTGKPTAQATSNVAVKKGRKAKLAFRVSDPAPSCGRATVTITIKLKSKIVKTIRVAGAPTGRALSYSFKVTLKRGS